MVLFAMVTGVNFPCCWYIWVYRALELIRAYACMKTPLDVAGGTNFIHQPVNPPIQDSNLQTSVLEIAR